MAVGTRQLLKVDESESYSGCERMVDDGSDLSCYLPETYGDCLGSARKDVRTRHLAHQPSICC